MKGKITMTYQLYTIGGQKVTVKNCSCYAEALHKTGFFDTEIRRYTTLN